MTGIRCNEIWQLSKKTFHWQLNFQKTQQEITDFKFQAEPRIAQIKEQIAKITAELPDTQTNKQK